MAIIALIGNKGGAGKTTLAINLAASLAEHGSTLLLDADPQHSSLQWRSIRGQRPGVEVRPADADPGAALAAAGGVGHVVLDCPPSIDAAQTRVALQHADLLVVPVQPSPLDLWASVRLQAEIDAARTRNPGLAVRLVINQLEPRTLLSQSMSAALAELSLPAAACAVSRRVVYRNAVLAGRSVIEMGQRGQAATREIRQLTEELVKLL